ncbi:MAG TPA: hypothetical protein PKL70_16625 [Saprospiraceae bacterium]|nr:hypothetical protein [Saprospiraceae bacterium]
MKAGEEIVINFIQEQAFLTDSKALNLDRLNLPGFVKRFERGAHLVCRILSYNAGEKKLFVEVLRYAPDYSAFTEYQDMVADALDGVESVVFRSIDTQKLLSCMKGPEPVLRDGEGRGEHRKPNRAIPEESEWSYLMPGFPDEPGTPDGQEGPAGFPGPAEKQTLQEEYGFFWKDLRFAFGAVQVLCKSAKLGRRVEVKIYNDHLRPEFDAIKNYFGKILKAKKIKVRVRYELEDHRIVHLQAYSPEIARIDRDLIDSVKLEWVKALPKKKIAAEVDKSLFTMDEYFEAATDQKIKPGLFYQDEKELLQDLLDISSSKHYKQLRFLSSNHAHRIMKLRFILHPFSFLFLIEGEKKYHVVWETLDTAEATYVWHIEKDLSELKRTMQKVEKIIETIKVQGKTAYIQNADEHYHRIYHDYSALVDGFVRWKGELEAVLS